jgi:hypothetical protein
MPFAFSQIEPQTTGRISRWDVPLNRWLGVKFGEGQDATIGRAWERFTDDMFDSGDMVSPEEANEVYGLPGLKFDKPISSSRAQHMYERKREELARAAYLEAASHSAISGKAVAGFGAMLLGGFAHPIDAATIFMPIVGSSAKAAQLGKAGAGSLRQAFARGLITTEQLAVVSKYPRFTAAVVEGTIGQAIVEIPVYAQKRKDQAVYGIEDSIINVALGGAFAGGIHAAAKGLSKALEVSGLMHQRLTPETKELIQREAIQAFVEGRPIDVRDPVRVDEEAIRARVVFDEAQARKEAEAETGPEQSGPLQPAVSDDLIKAWAKTIGLDEATIREAVGLPVAEMKARLRQMEEVSQARHAAGEPFDQNTNKGIGFYRYLVERVEKQGERAADPQKLAEVRQARIQEVIARKKAEFEATKEQRVTAERNAEISRQQAEGKVLSQEQVEQYKADPTAENAAAFLDEDISTIEQDLKAENDRLIAELGDETDEAVAAEQAALKEELDAELAELKEQAYQPRDKAIKAAIPCALEVISGQ